MDMPFHFFLQSFLQYLQFEKRYSRHTILAYQNDLEQFLSYISSQYEAQQLADIATSWVRSWLAELKAGKQTAKTINRKASSLKSFFKYQVRIGALSTTPMWSVSAPKISKRLPEFVQEKDMENMFRHLPFTDDWRGRTDRLLLQLFYQTGMRLSELVNLKENQVDGSRSVVKVLGKGNKERVIPIGAELLTALTAYQKEKRQQLENPDRVYFFVRENGRHVYAKYVYLAVKKYLSEATTLNKKSPHILRHSFATHLTNNGADLNAVKELLGHSSLASTQVYTHNSIQKLKDAHAKAHPKA